MLVIGASPELQRNRPVLLNPEPHVVHEVKVTFHRHYWVSCAPVSGPNTKETSLGVAKNLSASMDGHIMSLHVIPCRFSWKLWTTVLVSTANSAVSASNATWFHTIPHDFTWFHIITYQCYATYHHISSHIITRFHTSSHVRHSSSTVALFHLQFVAAMSTKLETPKASCCCLAVFVFLFSSSQDEEQQAPAEAVGVAAPDDRGQPGMKERLMIALDEARNDSTWI